MTGPRILAGDADGIAAAVSALQDGHLVGLPTETVYGLAADAEQPAAVARIYAVKGRPLDHPVIVHIAGADVVDQWAIDIPPVARTLMDAFWPGPLTVVLRRSQRVGNHLTGGQDTVALRCPSHSVALAVLRTFGGGVAAPSANRFGRVSTTTASHVAEEIGSLLDAEHDVILDGGASEVGVESTIVDCTSSIPRILRPGQIDHVALKRVTSLPIEPFAAPSASNTADASATPAAESVTPRVSGSLDSHYAPEAEVLLSTPTGVPAHVTASPGPHGLIAEAAVETPAGVVRLLAAESAQHYAANLYASLRRGDDLLLRTIIAVPPHHDDGDGVVPAIIDRLTRAAFPRH